jgi:general secretion pathway protein G
MGRLIRSGSVGASGGAGFSPQPGLQPRSGRRLKPPLQAKACSTCAGYTLIELIIVMAIISVLVSIAVPMYQKSLQRTKETLLKNNLFTLRNVIDEYTIDKQKAPQSLQDLVNEGYLRAVPIDPITGSDATWRIIMEDAISMVNQTQPGIFDVRSGSDQKSLEGTPYSEW